MFRWLIHSVFNWTGENLHLFSLNVTEWRAACEGLNRQWVQASWAVSEYVPLLPFWLKCSICKDCKCAMWGGRLRNEALKWFYLADIIELHVIIKISSSVWKWTSAPLLLRLQYRDHRHHHHHHRHYLSNAAEPYLMKCELRLSPYHPASWRRRRAPHSHCCQIFPQHAPEKKIWLVSRILYWCATLFLWKDV